MQLWKIIVEGQDAKYIYFRNTPMGSIYRVKIGDFNNRDALGMPRHYEFEAPHTSWPLRKIKLGL